VGIELLEPLGDCDGDFNGNQIFECKPGHGLFLRPTQVKSLNSPDVSKIMKMDESLLSGMDQLGSIIGADKEFNLAALNEDPTKEVKVQEVEE
jgi:dynactin complex subunit